MQKHHGQGPICLYATSYNLRCAAAFSGRLKAHGAAAIKQARAENPPAYFKGMLSLVQNDVSFEG